MKMMSEEKLKQLLEEAYEAGANDQSSGTADKETRDDYVLHTMAEL